MADLFGVFLQAWALSCFVLCCEFVSKDWRARDFQGRRVSDALGESVSVCVRRLRVLREGI